MFWILSVIVMKRLWTILFVHLYKLEAAKHNLNQFTTPG